MTIMIVKTFWGQISAAMIVDFITRNVTIVNKISYHTTAFKIAMFILKFLSWRDIISNFCIIQQKLVPILCYPCQHLQKKLEEIRGKKRDIALSISKMICSHWQFQYRIQWTLTNPNSTFHGNFVFNLDQGTVVAQNAKSFFFSHARLTENKIKTRLRKKNNINNNSYKLQTLIASAGFQKKFSKFMCQHPLLKVTL